MPIAGARQIEHQTKAPPPFPQRRTLPRAPRRSSVSFAEYRTSRLVRVARRPRSARRHSKFVGWHGGAPYQLVEAEKSGSEKTRSAPNSVRRRTWRKNAEYRTISCNSRYENGQAPSEKTSGPFQALHIKRTTPRKTATKFAR